MSTALVVDLFIQSFRSICKAALNKAPWHRITIPQYHEKYKEWAERRSRVVV